MADKITWKSETRKIADLLPANYNPRGMTAKEETDLRASLDKFDLADPIILNVGNRVIGGHQRLKILAKIGPDQQVDVRIPSRKLTLNEEKELNLRLNKNLGHWDEVLLAAFPETMLKDIGFSSEELDRIFRPRKRAEDDDVPIVGKSSIKPGDVFKLGNHRLACGDCRNVEIVKSLMLGEAAEMVFTDPPYNVAYEGNRTSKIRKQIANDKMTEKAFYDFLAEFLETAFQVCPGNFYICMSSSAIHVLRKAFDDHGGHWQTYIVWEKNSTTLTTCDYQQQSEMILYGWRRAKGAHYFINERTLTNVWEELDKVKATFDGENTLIKFHGFEVKIKGQVEGTVRKRQFKSDVWRFDKPVRSIEHPTMKPVAMVEHAIQNSSHREAIVLDPFGGSGSTLIACEKTNRRCRMIEIDPHYCEIICKRWEEYTGNEREKENG